MINFKYCSNLNKKKYLNILYYFKIKDFKEIKLISEES